MSPSIGILLLILGIVAGVFILIGRWLSRGASPRTGCISIAKNTTNLLLSKVNRQLGDLVRCP